MTNLITTKRLLPNVRQGRCYDCFRPHCDCFCAEIPRIDNQTEVLILQHKRERFHPFNTARIVRKALQHSNLLVGSTAEELAGAAASLLASPARARDIAGAAHALVARTYGWDASAAAVETAWQGAAAGV